MSENYKDLAQEILKQKGDFDNTEAFETRSQTNHLIAEPCQNCRDNLICQAQEQRNTVRQRQRDIKCVEKEIRQLERLLDQHRSKLADEISRHEVLKHKIEEAISL